MPTWIGGANPESWEKVPAAPLHYHHNRLVTVLPLEKCESSIRFLRI